MANQRELLDKKSIELALRELRTGTRRLARTLVVRIVVSFALILLAVALAFTWHRGASH